MQIANHGLVTGDFPTDIQLKNCGYYLDVDYDMQVSRPTGRSDHRLILVGKGCISVNIDGKIVSATEDTVIYLSPHMPQLFTYKKGEGTAYYWLHFDGRQAEDLIKKIGLEPGISKMRNVSKACEWMYELFHEYNAVPPYLSFELNGNLLLLLCYIGREIRMTKSVGKSTLFIEKISAEIRNNPEVGIPNTELAEKCNLSEYHFIRIFKKETGRTPCQYRLEALMEKAVRLLIDTDMNINEIAYALKFADPLYFSKQFKKRYGFSPSAYRDEYGNENQVRIE